MRKCIYLPPWSRQCVPGCQHKIARHQRRNFKNYCNRNLYLKHSLQVTLLPRTQSWNLEVEVYQDGGRWTGPLRESSDEGMRDSKRWGQVKGERRDVTDGRRRGPPSYPHCISPISIHRRKTVESYPVPPSGTRDQTVVVTGMETTRRVVSDVDPPDPPSAPVGEGIGWI